MDYDALANIIQRPTSTWNEQHVAKWLQFVHLQSLTASFAIHHLNGPRLLALTLPQLHAIGVTNSIIQRKLLRWIKEGFSQFESHLSLHADDKENIPPSQKQNIPALQRKMTTERETGKGIKRTAFQSQEDTMVVRSCDGNLAAFYVMKERSLKIGRSNFNTIRSLEVSFENQHAEIQRIHGKYYLRDNGTEAGTFIKIQSPKVLCEGSLVEMGSFLLQVIKMDLQNRQLFITVTHMVSKGTCDLIITLQDGCSFFSFGRRKTNDFSFDDQHLSGMHARIFLLHGQFALEDLHSTNGTWLRLSRPFEQSGNFLLEDGFTFKIGTTITYQCQYNRQTDEKMEIQYDDSCMACGKEKRNVLMLPCRHNIVCSNCVEPIKQCPMCQLQVHQKIKIYV